MIKRAIIFMQQDISAQAKAVQATRIDHLTINESPSNPTNHNGKIPKHLTKLPAKNEHFVGRKQELAQLKNDLAHDGIVYIVNGIGGVGKSELANKYLLDHEADYQHIALFELADSETPLRDTLYAALKKPLCVDNESTLEHIIQRLQGLPKKCLLVFDDLKNKADIASLKPLNYNCDVLITTRLQVSEAIFLNLDILNPEDARQLFLAYYPTDEAIDDILEYIDYHSLFIELIAKTLYEGYLSLDELREKFSNGEFTRINRDFEQTFNDFLRQSFAIEQQPALKTLLQQLAILPPIAIEYEVLAEIFTDTKRLKLMLAELAKRGWLIKKDNSYKLHQVIKAFILANHQLDFDKIIPKAIEPNHINDITIIDAILAAYPKEENLDIAILRNTQGNIYNYWGQYDKASHTLQIALQIRETHLGEQHPDTATSYNNLAYAYQSQGKLEQAITLHQKALTICEMQLGNQHLDTATSYNNLASVYKSQGKFEQAITLYQKALTTLETQLGEQHPHTATTYNNLALVYHAQGKLGQAITLHQKALIIHENVLSEQHLHTTYNNLALAYHAQGKLEQAITLFQQALTIRKNVLGEQHPDTATVYNNLGSAYDSQGNLAQAITLYQKALTIRENVLDEQHPDTANSYNNLAGAYKAQGKFEQAITLYQKALTICENVLGEHHPNTAGSAHNIAYTYLKLNYCQKALYYAKKALAIYNNLSYFDKKSLHTADLLKTIKHHIKKAKKLPLKRRLKICKD